jgi:hypothetical protein
VIGDLPKKNSLITKLYQCMMVREKFGAIWKPSQVPKGTLALQTNKTKKNTWTSNRKPLCLEKCHGTLKGIFSIVHGKEKH